jgi:hypothetical protein
MCGKGEAFQVFDRDFAGTMSTRQFSERVVPGPRGILSICHGTAE